MAKSKNKKTLRDDPTPFISRSYDPYSMEKRIYNLEQGGGVGPTPTPTNIITFEKTITTTSSGWWIATDENNNALNNSTDVLLNVTYMRTNEAEGEAAYLSSEFMLNADGTYAIRFVTMRDQSVPQNSSQTHKIQVTYMKKSEV